MYEYRPSHAVWVLFQFFTKRPTAAGLSTSTPSSGATHTYITRRRRDKQTPSSRNSICLRLINSMTTSIKPDRSSRAAFKVGRCATNDKPSNKEIAATATFDQYSELRVTVEGFSVECSMSSAASIQSEDIQTVPYDSRGAYPHCWSQPLANAFNVRGEEYLKDGKKIPSGEFLLPSRGVDLFISDECPWNVGRLVILDENGTFAFCLLLG